MEGQKESKADMAGSSACELAYRTKVGPDGLSHTSKHLHPEGSEHGAA